MKFLVLSDLHFEFHGDSGRSLLESIPSNDVDVCILAGDITVGSDIPRALDKFCRKYSVVLYVHGNHEFYNCTQEEVHDLTKEAEKQNGNLYWLNCSSVAVGGVRFLGGPMWFKPSPVPKWSMNDFRMIKRFESWVYKENQRFLRFAEGELTSQDIVVTHYLPSHRSVPSQYANDPLNAFFVCDVEHLIRDRQPRAWIHGHTHSSVDYHIGRTHVVCNPFGYAGDEENPEFNESFILEVDG